MILIKIVRKAWYVDRVMKAMAVRLILKVASIVLLQIVVLNQVMLLALQVKKTNNIHYTQCIL